MSPPTDRRPLGRLNATDKRDTSIAKFFDALTGLVKKAEKALDIMIDQEKK